MPSAWEVAKSGSREVGTMVVSAMRMGLVWSKFGLEICMACLVGNEWGSELPFLVTDSAGYIRVKEGFYVLKDLRYYAYRVTLR